MVWCVLPQGSWPAMFSAVDKFPQASTTYTITATLAMSLAQILLHAFHHWHSYSLSLYQNSSVCMPLILTSVCMLWTFLSITSSYSLHVQPLFPFRPVDSAQVYREGAFCRATGDCRENKKEVFEDSQWLLPQRHKVYPKQWNLNRGPAGCVWAVPNVDGRGASRSRIPQYGALGCRLQGPAWDTFWCCAQICLLCKRLQFLWQ